MNARRIVLDTNIYISAFLFGGPPERVIRLILSGALECCISVPILDELRDVLQRTKFGLTADQALAIAEEARAMCRVVTPMCTVADVTLDPDDNHVLAYALAADADAIVSGDFHLLALKQWRGRPILNPAALLRTMDTPPGAT
ncbi:MAG: putative toxin-antitoxin system toxin component, PIN family [Lentisphaerae bacterium]|nr:putative toxin-antitoxin system toxin component, PIN family [Lentisphaerota bacterium]